MTKSQWPIFSRDTTQWLLGLGHWGFLYRRSSPSLDVVYQMRKQLCQLLFEKRKNLLAAVEPLGGGELFQSKCPVKHRMGAEVSHGTLDRMGGAVQKLPIAGIHGPLNLV